MRVHNRYLKTETLAGYREPTSQGTPPVQHRRDGSQDLSHKETCVANDGIDIHQFTALITRVYLPDTEPVHAHASTNGMSTKRKWAGNYSGFLRESNQLPDELITSLSEKNRRAWPVPSATGQRPAESMHLTVAACHAHDLADHGDPLCQRSRHEHN
jgi:hypothetical protein